MADEATLLAEDHDYAQGESSGAVWSSSRIRVPVSMRRFEKDGHVNIALKYVAAEAHRIFLGPINSNIFRYRFGHYEESRCRRRDRGGS